MTERAQFVGGAVLAVALLAGCTTAAPVPAPDPDDCGPLKSLAVAAWADRAGLVPDERSIDTWAEQNPELASFVPAGEQAVDVAGLWQRRGSEPDAWNDLLRWFDSEGRPWLVESGFDETIPLSDPGLDPGEDVLGWQECAD